MNTDERMDEELGAVLRDFRESVQAWSKTAYARPRTAIVTPRKRVWRLAAGWVLGCALVVGGISGGVYEQQHRQELARVEAVRAAEHERQAAAERAREEEDLLAQVDSDVARQTPSAMEPLARLMAEDESQ